MKEHPWSSRLRRFHITPQNLLMRFFSAWCLAGVYCLGTVKAGFDVLEFVRLIHPGEYALVFLSAYAVITAAVVLVNRPPLENWILLGSVILYAFFTLIRTSKFYYAFGLLAVLVFVGYYLLRDDKLCTEKIALSDKTLKLLVAAGGAFVALFIGGLTTLRYLSNNAPCFDFGIFAQMFHHMKETLLPNTTCERDQLLSHFAVHISPIYYTLLPGYFLFDSPVYLQVMQALILASGVIPLYLLARNAGLGNKAILFICIAYCSYPALSGGCFYDIHENCFLTPLILWLLYCYEKRKFLGVYVFALLTMMVKEDAPVYVACIALYLFISRREYRHGAILFCGSLLYFGGALALLRTFGEGVMTGRYDNYIAEPSLGLFSVIKTLFLNPAYAIDQMITEEKLIFALLMLLPVACLPFLGKKLSQLILCIPFLLINMLPNYVYQHSIHFQYIFGVTALFFYLVVVNARELSHHARKYALTLSLAASVLLFVSQMSGRVDYIRIYRDNYVDNQLIDSHLADIPKDASVQASSFFVPKLSNRMELYQHASKHVTDFIALDLRPGREANMPDTIESCLEQGYTLVAYEEDLIAVLCSPEYGAASG